MLLDAMRIGDTVDIAAFKTIDGKTFNFNAYKGKKSVVVSFWVPSCDLCIKQLKLLQQEMNKNNRAKDTVVLSVVRASNYELDMVKNIVKTNKLKAAFVTDPDTKLSMRFGVNMAPTFIIIDKKGRIASDRINFVNKPIRQMNFIQMLDTVRKGKDVPVIQFEPFTKSQSLRNMIGEKETDFELLSITDDTPYSIKNYIGKMNVVLLFWHPYSSKSTGFINWVNSFYTEENRRKYNFVVLAPSSIYGNSQSDEAKKLINELNGSIVFLNDKESKIGKLYKVKNTPTVFIIGKNGKILDVVTGESSGNDLQKHIVAAFD